MSNVSGPPLPPPPPHHHHQHLNTFDTTGNLPVPAPSSLSAITTATFLTSPPQPQQMEDHQHHQHHQQQQQVLSNSIVASTADQEVSAVPTTSGLPDTTSLCHVFPTTDIEQPLQPSASVVMSSSVPRLDGSNITVVSQANYDSITSQSYFVPQGNNSPPPPLQSQNAHLTNHQASAVLSSNLSQFTMSTPVVPPDAPLVPMSRSVLCIPASGPSNSQVSILYQ